MDTARLKTFATKARVELLKEVGARLDVVLAANSVARVESLQAIKALELAIAGHDRQAVVDRVAYTWFNRIIALRFMDANGYTPSRVVSPESGRETGQPEILAEAKSGTFDHSVVPAKTAETITSFLNGTRSSSDPQGEAYGLLLEAYCRHWNKHMPFMFEREGDYTELLIPGALLATDSVRDQAVRVLTSEVCQNVEVIGWLYQFYISERKDEVFAGFKKNKKAGADEIPAATQLFTPHWIVRYLVENSLGRLWMLNRPSSRLVGQMEYYIASVDEETDFLKVSRPEELKVVDPACGSGHMLTYAFDLLYAIYEEEGYAPAEIPGLVLTNNLYGVEIDPRAGALAAFALAMKARAKQRTFFNKQVEPNVCVLDPISFTPDEIDFLLTRGGDKHAETAFWNQFEHADTFGSLIQPDPELTVRLKQHIAQLDDGGDILLADVLDWAERVVLQAEYLTARYAVAVANPPYMGAKNMGSRLAEFAERRFPGSKNDLFAVFIERNRALVRPHGHIAMITMQSWMFIKSFLSLRQDLLGSQRLASMAHLGTGAFESITGEVVSTTAWVMQQSSPNGRTAFMRLVDLRGDAKRLEVARVSAGEPTPRLYRVAQAALRGLPGSPVAYWLGERLVAAFSAGQSIGSRFDIKVGMQTSNNAKYLRQWWEPSVAALSTDRDGLPAWITYAKGGPFRRWTGNLDSVLHFNFDPDYVLAQPNATVLPMQALNFEKITWTHMSPGAVSFRLLPETTFHDIGGHAIYTSGADSHWLLGYLNSRFVGSLVQALNPTVNIQTSDIARIPIIDLDTDALSQLAVEAVAISSEDELTQETVRNFERSTLLGGATRLGEGVEARRMHWIAQIARLRKIEDEIEELVASAAGTEPALGTGQITLFNTPDDRPDWARAQVSDLVSYATGCMFGRYSLDEPGLILANQGATVQDYLAKVPNPTFAPDEDNVIPIVDGDWFEDDVVARFRTFLRTAFGEQHFEENLRFVTESLGVKDVRDYFVRSFYKDHVQRYKKRPIYWLFSSPRGSFKALVYLHRYTPSTVSTVLNEYLHAFENKLEANLEHQERVAAGLSGASAREAAAAQKEAERIRKILVELREYERETLYPLAQQQLALDLDDGVLVNYVKLGPALQDIGLKKDASDE